MSDGVNDEFDFIRDVIPGIRKGMLLCNQYGDQWEVLDTDQTNTGKKLLILLSNDDNVRTQPKPYTAAYIIDRIINGTLTICDTIKEDLTESDDFDWAKGDIEYPIDFLIGKNIYWRQNNLGSLEDAGYTMGELNKKDLTLGAIRWSNSWVLTGFAGENVSLKLTGGGVTTYSISEVKNYVRLGIWVVENDNGRLLNESEEFDWIKDIEPEITPKSIPMYYNKPFYWYNNGKPVSEWGMPRIYWLEGWKPYSRVDEEQMSLFCYKDLSVSSEIYNSECTEFLNRTIVNYIKRGIIVFQPQLSDIKND